MPWYLVWALPFLALARPRRRWRRWRRRDVLAGRSAACRRCPGSCTTSATSRRGCDDRAGQPPRVRAVGAVSTPKPSRASSRRGHRAAERVRLLRFCVVGVVEHRRHARGVHAAVGARLPGRRGRGARVRRRRGQQLRTATAAGRSQTCAAAHRAWLRFSLDPGGRRAGQRHGRRGAGQPPDGRHLAAECAVLPCVTASSLLPVAPVRLPRPLSARSSSRLLLAAAAVAVAVAAGLAGLTSAPRSQRDGAHADDDDLRAAAGAAATGSPPIDGRIPVVVHVGARAQAGRAAVLALPGAGQTARDFAQLHRLLPSGRPRRLLGRLSDGDRLAAVLEHLGCHPRQARRRRLPAQDHHGRAGGDMRGPAPRRRHRRLQRRRNERTDGLRRRRPDRRRGARRRRLRVAARAATRRGRSRSSRSTASSTTSCPTAARARRASGAVPAFLAQWRRLDGCTGAARRARRPARAWSNCAGRPARAARRPARAHRRRRPRLARRGRPDRAQRVRLDAAHLGVLVVLPATLSFSAGSRCARSSSDRAAARPPCRAARDRRRSDAAAGRYAWRWRTPRCRSAR